jgi:hypothetical protein
MATIVALAPHLSWEQRAIALNSELAQSCSIIRFVLREVSVEGRTMWSSHPRQHVHDAQHQRGTDHNHQGRQDE